MIDPFEKRVVVLPDVQAKFTGFDETLELTAPSGKALGYFVPEKEYRALVLARLSMEPTAEELQESMEDYRKNGGYTTAQVLEHLAAVERVWKERQR